MDAMRPIDPWHAWADLAVAAVPMVGDGVNDAPVHEASVLVVTANAMRLLRHPDLPPLGPRVDEPQPGAGTVNQAA